MKIALPASSLYGVVSGVQSGVAQKTTKPILTNVKLVAKDGLLTATATDLNIAVTRSVPCDVEPGKAFAAVVEPRRLAGILKECGDNPITFWMQDGCMELRAGFGSWRLLSESPDDFPDVPEPTDVALELFIQTGLLKQAFRRASFASAATNSENKDFSLKGINIEVEQSKLRLATSDINSVAVAEVPCSTGDLDPSKFKSCIVPIRALQLFIANIKSAEEKVTIRLTPKRVYFSGDNATVATALIGGKFPPYRLAMPKKVVAKVKLTLPEFASKVRLAAMTADFDKKRVDFAFGPGLIEMRSGGSTTGSGDVNHTLGADDYEGKPINVGFFPEYITDFLAAVADETYGTFELSERNCILRAGYAYTMISQLEAGK